MPMPCCPGIHSSGAVQPGQAEGARLCDLHEGCFSLSPSHGARGQGWSRQSLPHHTSDPGLSLLSHLGGSAARHPGEGALCPGTRICGAPREWGERAWPAAGQGHGGPWGPPEHSFMTCRCVNEGSLQPQEGSRHGAQIPTGMKTGLACQEESPPIQGAG